MPRILIVVPAYNEAASIRSVLDAVRGVRAPSWTILVVNDGSTDGTGGIAASVENVQVINHCVNLGIGGAMQTGFIYAVENKFDFVVQVDGDGQHHAGEIGKLLRCLQQKPADMVVGSRFLTNDNPAQFRSSRPRRIGIRLLFLVNRVLTGQTIYDVTSGFRAYNRTAFSLAARLFPTDYPEPEALILFHKAGLRMAEIPVLMSSRRGGVSSITGIKSVYYIVKVLVALCIYSLRSRSFFTSGGT